MGTYELNIILHYNLDQKTKNKINPEKTNKQIVKSEQNKHLVYRLTIHL